jgi:pimeloyl-ACP methyl ester carboxylesterase
MRFPGAKPLWLAGLAICGAAAGGCFLPPAPPIERIVDAISYGLLQPEVTCAELREDFELYDLPIVETPDEIGIAYEDHVVAAPDGNELHVWFMPVEDARGTVIVSSGNTGTKACYLFTAQLLTGARFTVVMYDYEGFGGSTGAAALRNLRGDLEAVLDWTLAYTGANELTLFGMSLGSIPTLAVAVEHPDVVNGVVLDSPVALINQIRRFAIVVRGRTEQVLAALEPWLLSEEIISQVQQPLLIYVHEEDLVTPPRTIAALVAAATAPTTVVSFAGLGHAAGQFLATAEYAQYLAAFLDTVWSRAD